MSSSSSPHRGVAAEDGSAGSDRVAKLEQQLNELRQLLVQERQKHKEEQRAAATRLRLLETSAKAASTTETSTSGNGVVKTTTTITRRTVTSTSNTPRGPPTPREMVLSTPRTSDSLFVAVKSSSATTARASTTVKSRVGSARVGVAKGATTPRDASPAKTAVVAAAAPAAPQQPTALQHAWDKFCYLAREQFTPEQLALVSAETLDKLLDHYKVTNPIERAQIEAQWALLQEGKETVGEMATPRVVQPASRKAIHRAVHTSEFNLRPDQPKPKLSRKQLLCAEAPKPSNPNVSTSASPLIRSNSMQIIRPRGIAVGNPNETESRPGTPRLCFRRCETATDTPRETPRGMMHVAGPTSKEHKDRGIRSEGSTFEGPDRSKIESVRTGYGHRDDDAKNRGVRTFEKESSPTRSHRPTKIVSTPPHIQRWHLGTATLGTNGQRPPAPAVSPRQARTPFALDD